MARTSCHSVSTLPTWKRIPRKLESRKSVGRRNTSEWKIRQVRGEEGNAAKEGNGASDSGGCYWDRGPESAYYHPGRPHVLSQRGFLGARLKSYLLWRANGRYRSQAAFFPSLFPADYRRELLRRFFQRR